MASVPPNPTQLTPPRVAFIDERSGAISREWYRFFLSLLTSTESNQQEASIAVDTNSLLATYDAMLASVAQVSETASNGMVTSLESSLISLQNAFGVTPPDLGGTVTSVAASGGSTGLTFTGSPITTSGTLTLGGTLAVANGGTGTGTAFTAGSIVFAGASGVYGQDNTNLFWDDSNNRLGVGTAAPGYKLDVNGTFGFAPGASVTPADNGDVVFELTNNFTLTVKAKGSDGVVRSGTIILT